MSVHRTADKVSVGYYCGTHRFIIQCPPYFIVVPKSSTRAKQPSLVQVVLGRSDGGQEGGGGGNCARRQHQRMDLEGERFSRPKSSFIFPTNTTMLLASGGAPHHDFHSECMSNDDKGNAVNCNCLRLLLEQRHATRWCAMASCSLKQQCVPRPWNITSNS